MATKKRKSIVDLIKDRASPQAPQAPSVPQAPQERQVPQETKAPQAPSVPQVIRDQDTGKLTGVVQEGKPSFLGLPPRDVSAIVARRNEGTQIPQGSADLAQSIELQKRRIAGFQAAQQLGNLNPEILEQVKQGKIDINQVLSAGASAVVPSLVGGVIAGGAAAATGVGAPAAPFIIGGAAIGGSILAARSNLKAQKQGLITASSQGLKDAQVELNRLISLANQDPANALTYADMFNEHLSYIERDYGILKLDTEGFLSDITGAGGTPQLSDYARFYQPNGQRQRLILQMETALLNPNPNNILTTSEDINPTASSTEPASGGFF